MILLEAILLAEYLIRFLYALVTTLGSRLHTFLGHLRLAVAFRLPIDRVDNYSRNERP
jgi:hypothetical protein